MKNFFKNIFRQIKYFFINPLWLSKSAWLLIFISAAANAYLWYIYIKSYHDLVGPIPISYASAVVVLNIFLANLSYRKQPIVAIILLGASLLIQMIFLISLRFFAMNQAF